MAPLETVPKPADIETVVTARSGDTLGYARVSSNDQNPEAQRAGLIETSAIRVFTDVVSGKRFDRPGLAELIDHARPGDRLCVTKLDRLGRSLRELLETVEGLKARGIHLVNLEERLDTSSATDELVFLPASSQPHLLRTLGLLLCGLWGGAVLSGGALAGDGLAQSLEQAFEVSHPLTKHPDVLPNLRDLAAVLLPVRRHLTADLRDLATHAADRSENDDKNCHPGPDDGPFSGSHAYLQSAKGSRTTARSLPDCR